MTIAGEPKTSLQQRLTYVIITTCLTFIILLNSGCTSSTYLPSARETTQSPWKSFDDVKTAFDKITPEQTTVEELRQMGFDPFITPNIELINYLEIAQRFIPNQSVQKEDLNEAIQKCLDMHEHCHAYDIDLHHASRNRYGNVVFDIFNFRRKTKLTGWQFRAIILMQDDQVTYKLWSGKPKIDENSDTKNPFGPFQSSEKVLWKAVE